MRWNPAISSQAARRRVQAARYLLLPFFVLVLAAATQDDGQSAPPPDATDPSAVEDAPPRLPDALRNPRALRQEQGVAQGPRMVAGAMSLSPETPLDVYTRLEPIIGAFTFTGSQWMRPDSEPLEFSGAWTNRWILDGLYLESSFTLSDRSGSPYEVLGLTWYDEADQRYEAQFFNSTTLTQTLRWGNFDGADETAASEAEAPTDEATTGAAPSEPESATAEPPTLTMFSRSTNQPEDAEPNSRYELVIVSVNEFRYLGYNRGRDGTGAWRKTFEMTMTRTEPIALSAGESEG